MLLLNWNRQKVDRWSLIYLAWASAAYRSSVNMVSEGLQNDRGDTRRQASKPVEVETYNMTSRRSLVCISVLKLSETSFMKAGDPPDFSLAIMQHGWYLPETTTNARLELRSLQGWAHLLIEPVTHVRIACAAALGSSEAEWGSNLLGDPQETIHHSKRSTSRCCRKCIHACGGQTQHIWCVSLKHIM